MRKGLALVFFVQQLLYIMVLFYLRPKVALTVLKQLHQSDLDQQSGNSWTNEENEQNCLRDKLFWFQKAVSASVRDRHYLDLVLSLQNTFQPIVLLLVFLCPRQ